MGTVTPSLSKRLKPNQSDALFLLFIFNNGPFNSKMFKTSLCVVFFLSCTIALDITANVHMHNKVVTCYVASWAAYRPDNGAFTWENIDPTLCTHIIYSFAGMNNNTFEVNSLDPNLDLEKDGGQYRKIINLKKNQPNLKVLIAVGGWNEGTIRLRRRSGRCHGVGHRQRRFRSRVFIS